MFSSVFLVRKGFCIFQSLHLGIHYSGSISLAKMCLFRFKFIFILENISWIQTLYFSSNFTPSLETPHRCMLDLPSFASLSFSCSFMFILSSISFVHLPYFSPLCLGVFFCVLLCFTFMFLPFLSFLLCWFYFLFPSFQRSVSFYFTSATFLTIYFLRTLISTLWYYSREAIDIQLFKFLIKCSLTVFSWCMDLSINLLPFGFYIILGLTAAKIDKCLTCATAKTRFGCLLFM